MKKTIQILLFILAVSSFDSWAISRDEILNKVVLNLSQFKTVEYSLDLHQCFESQGVNLQENVTCYFDFSSTDSIIGSKYLFSSARINAAYKGGFMYQSDTVNKQIIYSNKPTQYMVTAQPYLSNSIYIIRKILPKLVSDSSITFTRSNDTIVDKTACYNYKILLKNKYISGEGILTNAKGINTNLMLLISKNNYLPKQFTTFYLNPGYIQATFSNIKTPAFRADSLWNYNWLSEEYLPIAYEDLGKNTLASVTKQIGKQAPDWTLPMIKGDSVKLSAQKDKLILLVFWYQGCGACTKAVPYMNEIQKEFAGKGLKVYGIEFVKINTKGLAEYIDKNKIEYPTLYFGNKVAKEYGVVAAPTFFLINNQRRIVYAGAGFNQINLLKAIKDNIE